MIRLRFEAVHPSMCGSWPSMVSQARRQSLGELGQGPKGRTMLAGLAPLHNAPGYERD